MKKRIIVASIMLVVLGGAFALRLINSYGVYIFDLLIAALAIFCALEFAKLLSTTGVPASQMAAGLYPSLMFAAHMTFFIIDSINVYWYVVIQLGLLLVASWATFFVYLCLNTKKIKEYRAENKMGRCEYAFRIALKAFLTFVYPTMCLLGLMLLNRIDMLGGGFVAFSGYFGWVALILAFLIPIVTDTSAMLCGMLFKGPKLCPKISPKKTISGAVSATVLTSIVTGAFFYIFNCFEAINLGFVEIGMNVWHFVLLGFIGAIVCQVGDIFESFMKRKAGVKDSGNIFPGHGGFLDRLDSHIFNAPYVLLFFILFILI